MDVQPTSFDKDINDRYARFAADTYKTLESDIRNAVNTNSSGRSVLLVIGEEHQDSDAELEINNRVPIEEQEPALAAAISEISALEAASRLVGKENVTLSVEVNPRTLGVITQMLKDNQGFVPETLHPNPLAHTIAYAIQNGINVAPVDDSGFSGEVRNEFLVDSISNLSTQAGVAENPSVVVHVTGIKHLSNLAGYEDYEVDNAEGKITADPERSPFKYSYDQTLMYNTARFPRALMYVFNNSDQDNPTVKNLVSEIEFATNPDNAVQIDSPGAMESRNTLNLTSLVQNTAQQHDLRMADNDAEGTIQFANVDMNKF